MEETQLAQESTPDNSRNEHLERTRVSNAAAVIGPPNEWTSRTIDLWGTRTTFTRNVAIDIHGKPVVEVSMDCSDPTFFYLSRMNDADYWQGGKWSTYCSERQTWAAHIVQKMLEEGLVSTGKDGSRISDQVDDDDINGVRETMETAATPKNLNSKHPTQTHSLSKCVSKVRGLRIVQGLAPQTRFPSIKFAGYDIPYRLHDLMFGVFNHVAHRYATLYRPPWDSVPWGQQNVAGHALNVYTADPIFVGENSDLLWRALTETDSTGISPMRAVPNLNENGLMYGNRAELLVAAALYDKTAERQLTTDLFVGSFSEHSREILKSRILHAFKQATTKKSRWSEEQQERIHGFINVVSELEPRQK